MTVTTNQQPEEQAPTYHDIRAERAKIVQEISALDRELIKLRSLRMPRHTYAQERGEIVERLNVLRADLAVLNVEATERFPDGARKNDEGRKFWRERAFSLVQSLDAILDDETASPTVKAVVQAAQREYARAMSSHKNSDTDV